MRPTLSSGSLLSAAVLAAFTMLSCSPTGGRSGSAELAPGPVVERTEIPNVPPPTERSAVVTFVVGDVESTLGSDWSPVSLGDALQAEHRVRTLAASSCEIQFGALAVVRLEENTEVRIAALTLGDSRQVGVSLAVGAMISKVEKLAENDRYNVRTATTIAGVRGTEFRVEVGRTNETSLAVRDGSVAVLPPDAILPAAKGISEEESQRVYAALAASARTVAPGEEIVVSSSDFAKATEQLAEVRQRLDQGATLENVSPLLEEAAKATAEEAPKPVAASARAQAALAVAATMQLLPPAPEAPTQAVAKPAVVPLSVSVEPRSAQLLVNGAVVATGSFSRLYPVGDALKLTARLDGYESESLDFTVPAAGTKLTIRLQPQRSSAQPPSAPSASAAAPAPGQSAASAAAPVAAQPGASETPPADRTAASAAASQPAAGATAASVPAATVAPQPAPPSPPARIQLSLQVVPEAAAIFVNGARVGTGAARIELPAGERVTVEASAEGYAADSRQLTVAAGEPARVALSLARKPIVGSYPVAQGAIVKEIVGSAGGALVADARGNVAFVERSGNVRWSVSTANAPNDNSAPVATERCIYFSGAKELVGIDPRTGTVLFRRPLAQPEAHTFGRRVVAAGGELFCPTDGALLVFAEGSDRLLRRVTLPVASSGSPLARETLLYVVDQEGTLARIDRATGAVVGTIETKAAQPVASAPVALAGGRIAIVGRRGVVAVADDSKVIWQRALDAKQSIGVFTDPAVGSDALYVYGKNTLYALSSATGEELFAPITGVSAPPLVDGSSLYYGTTDGRFVRADARSGASLAELRLPSPLSAQPARVDTLIAVGSKNGQVTFVYPGTM